MVLHRAEQRIEHGSFRDFPSFIHPGDIVMLNDTRVIPARAFTTTADRVPFPQAQPATAEYPSIWKCLVKPVGSADRAETQLGGIMASVLGIEPDGEPSSLRARAGSRKARRASPAPLLWPRAGKLRRGALPTVTPAARLRCRANGGTPLHARGSCPRTAYFPHTARGRGTFRPVQVDDLAQHRCTRRILHQRGNRRRGKRRIASDRRRHHHGAGWKHRTPDHAQSGETSIFIHPPYTPRVVDVLLTNFHLPKSTLLMLGAPSLA